MEYFFRKYTFKYKTLPSLNIGPLVFKFSLLKELFKNKSDCFIVAENPKETKILGEGARELVKEEYYWRKIIKRS